MRSRVTLAMIEAAPIERHFASPSTIGLDGRCHLGSALPSTRTHAGSMPERLDRAGHRQHLRPIDVELVDLLDARDSDAPGDGLLHQPAVERLALLERNVLRIVDPAREFLAVEDAGGGDHRPRERRASRLVHPGERLRKFELELEGTAPRHRVATLAQSLFVIPAKAGIHLFFLVDSRRKVDPGSSPG